MPYSNIVFIKLFLDLFDQDDRFLYQLNESQQLLYVKLLYLAGRTDNEIPKNIKYIRHKINYPHDESCFLADLKRIMSIFPKFNETDNCYYFNKFNELHNRISKRNAKGTPKELQRNVPEEEKEKEKEKEELFTYLWNLYPKLRRQGRDVAYKRFSKGLKEKDYPITKQALNNYIESDNVKKGFILRASKWFGEWRDWIDHTPEKKVASRTDL